MCERVWRTSALEREREEGERERGRGSAFSFLFTFPSFQDKVRFTSYLFLATPPHPNKHPSVNHTNPHSHTQTLPPLHVITASKDRRERNLPSPEKNVNIQEEKSKCAKLSFSTLSLTQTLPPLHVITASKDRRERNLHRPIMSMTMYADMKRRERENVKKRGRKRRAWK